MKKPRCTGVTKFLRSPRTFLHAVAQRKSLSSFQYLFASGASFFHLFGTRHAAVLSRPSAFRFRISDFGFWASFGLRVSAFGLLLFLLFSNLTAQAEFRAVIAIRVVTPDPLLS